MNQEQKKQQSPEDEKTRRIATRVIAVAFLLSFAGDAGFLYVCWYRAESIMLLGITAGTAFLGIFVGLVVWAHKLMPHEVVHGPRETFSATDAERERFLEDFVAGKEQIGRRRFLGRIVMVALGGLSLGIIALMRSLIETPISELKQVIWKRGDRLVTIEGHPVSADMLTPGGTIPVYPQGRVGDMAAETVLIRVEEHLINLPKERSTWTPKGYLAYSRVCTHAGCTVALYERTKHLLLCPCHQSTFTILDGAQPISGPAARPLPQVPLYVDSDGNLRARGHFTAHPGPGFWRLYT